MPPIDSFHSSVCTSEYLLHLMSLILLILPKFLLERDEFHLISLYTYGKRKGLDTQPGLG